MLRKLLIAAAVAAASLALAAIALAVTQQNFSQKFTSKNVSKPTGSSFHTDSTDPANTANNKQPAGTKEVDIIFPSGSVINPSALPSCSATDQDFNSKGISACPSKTQIGHQKPKCHGTTAAVQNCSGHANVRLKFGSDIAARIYAFNGKSKSLILYIVPNGANPIVLRPKIKTGSTPKIVTKIPILCALGSPPSCGSAGEARLSSFDLTIDKINKSGKVFLTTPSTCPSSKKWTFKGTFKFRKATGTEPPQPASITKTSLSPCK